MAVAEEPSKTLHYAGHTLPPEHPAPRFVYIDGLRGIAAVAVVLVHVMFDSELTNALGTIFPLWMQAILHRGDLGVQIFFVISGFVICYSLRSTPMRPAEIGNFALRRQLRLDIPYWTVCTMALLEFGVAKSFPSPKQLPFPSLKEILINFFYLQKLTHTSRELLTPGWTLCIEIQFYLAFIALLVVASVGAKMQRPRMWAASMLALVTGIASSYTTYKWDHFVPHWHYFTAGALCCWALQPGNKIARVALLIHSIVIPTWMMTRHGFDQRVVTELVTVASIYWLGMAGKLTTALGQKPFQFFGRMSYSLYLVHMPVLMVIMNFGRKLTHDKPGFAVMWLVISLIASVVAAVIFYKFVERPSVKFASRFKREQRRSSKRELAGPQPNAPSLAAELPAL